MQVRTRRILQPQSAHLLLTLLKEERKRRKKVALFLQREGRTVTRTMTTRERKIRPYALAKHGYACMMCGFDFVETYGEWAKECVEVHHLNALSEARKSGRITSLDEVIVVCPNCHRAIHKYDDPSDWKRFKRECGVL